MKSLSLTKTTTRHQRFKHKPPTLSHRELVEYYSEAGADYHAWSKNFNMHFGFFRWGQNPFKREAMLEQMNQEVFSRLALTPESKILDAGCGLGATARQLAKQYPTCRAEAITIVPWQIEQALTITKKQGLQKQINFSLQDFTKTSFAAESFDGAYALESSCYATGLSKQDFLQETFRQLKPGATLVVADGFRKDTRALNKPLQKIYNTITRCWKVNQFAELNSFVNAMKQIGYVDIVVEEISYNIAISVMHIPFVTLKFLFQQIFSRKKFGPMRKDNLIAPLLAPFLGLARKRYGYYFISGRKPL